MAEVIFSSAKDYLLLEYQLRKTRRAAYSQRAFARDLSFSPSSLTDFLKGRVGMSESRIETLASKLNWSQDRKEIFKNLVYSKFGKDNATRAASKMKVKLLVKDNQSYISVEKFKSICQWYNFVMIEMFELNDNISAKDIAKELDLSLAEVNAAVKSLLAAGMIEDTAKGYKPTTNVRQSGDDIPSDAIKNFHHQILQQCQLALYNKPFEDRESHSLVFSMRSEDKAKMNEEIRQSLYQIVNKYALEAAANSTQIISFQSFEVFKKKDS